MKYVLDASVAVAALRSQEPQHASALRRCLPLFAGRDEIVVPAIFDIEVVSALVRRGAAPASVDRFFEKHFASRKLVTIGPRAARAARLDSELDPVTCRRRIVRLARRARRATAHHG